MPATVCRAARCPARNIPEKPADPLMVHPDIRRMLLEIRTFNEAARALGPVGGAAKRHRPSQRRRKGARKGADDLWA